MRVFEDRYLARNDVLANPPSEVYNEWQVYKIRLKRLGLEVELLVETVREYGSMYEVFGMFLDEDQWYNIKIHLWKDPTEPSYVRIVPWPDSALAKKEITYQNSVALFVKLYPPS